MHIYVLGSGIVGVTTAYYLAKKGFEVTVLDRQDGPALETSFANAGQISPGYASPWAAPGIPLKAIKWLFQEDAPLIMKPTLDIAQYRWLWSLLRNCTAKNYAINKERMVRLSEYSRLCFDRLRQETGIRYEDRQRGTIQLFRTQQQLDDSAKDIQVLKEMGTPFEVLDRAGILRYEPGLKETINEFVGALRLPLDETGDCFIFSERLVELAKALGVRFQFAQHIERFDDQNGVIKGIWVNGELVTADAYVVALGSYSTALLKQVGIDVPIYPLKGFSLTVPIIDESKAPQSTVLDETYKVALTRFDQRIRMGGMAGVNGFDLSLKDKYLKTMHKIFNHVFPNSGNLQEATFWTGLRPATPDGTPIVGGTRYSNLWINSGHGTLGWTMSCGAAHYLADLIAGEKPEISTEGLDISRYTR
ncbi:D-amino acid dehydrogenase [Pelistega sp. NLN82]|uniref:D-amino acid dehydrogenase n=1 Tax=Pelistega ratti TaxID=2652177 RepID=A0A6L9Y5Z6_9BURK|nr:D-amino acid dehydrogenase [Pelistega ratti]NEN75228.1 D-amino acid dehydrogenase [Pelistega ratti]